MIFRIILLFCFLGILNGVLAQQIDSISFEPKNVEALIDKDKLSSKRYEKFSKKKADLDCALLMKQGYFESVSYKLVNQSGKTNLVFFLRSNETATILRILNSPVNINRFFRDLVGSEKPINWRLLNQSIEKATDYVKSKGYSLFRVEKVFVKHDTLIIETNPGKIKKLTLEVDQNKTLKKLSRFLESKVGGVPYKTSLDKDLQRLLSLDYFSGVTPPVIYQSNKDIYHNDAEIIFTLQERPSNWFDLGIEQLKDNDGVGIFYQVSKQNFIASSDWLSFKHQIQLSQKIQSKQFGLAYNHLWLDLITPIRSEWSTWRFDRLDSFANNDEMFNTQRQGASWELFYPIVYSNLGLSHRFLTEKVIILDSVDLDTYYIHALDFKLDYKQTDNIINPKKGFEFYFDYRYAFDISLFRTKGLGFNRFESDLRLYYPLADKVSLANRIVYGEFNQTHNQNSFESEGFFLGGNSSLRGYPYYDSYGHKRLFSNIEIRCDIDKSKELIFFADFGKTANDSFSLFDSKYKLGVGVGVLFITPLAPLRVDLAKGKEVMLHLSVGKLF